MLESVTTKRVNMNGVAEDPPLPTVYRAIKPKQPISADATVVKTNSILHDQLAQRLDNECDEKKKKCASDPFCNGILVSSTDSVADKNAKNSTTKLTSLDSTTEVVNAVAAPVSSNFSNVVLLNSLTKTLTKAEALKSSKLYVLNGNVLKEAGDIDKMVTDNMNYICLTNNFGNVIKKIKCDGIIKNGKPVIACSGGSDADGEKSKLMATVPTFIQLSHSNLAKTSAAGACPKIAFSVSPTLVTNVTKSPAVGNFEILRSKLLETNSVAAITAASNNQQQSASKDALPSRSTAKPTSATNQNTVSVTNVIAGDKNGSIGGAYLKKELLTDSPTVTKARNELVRCRKALIEAAIHPQLPTYVPPASYVGPTYTCEECEDSFASTDGLNNHKNRRCVLFTYACPVCKKTLEFYNRCMFLLHVRSHDVAVKACFLNISVIPANKLNFTVLDNEIHARENDSPTQLLEASNCNDSVASAELPSFAPVELANKASTGRTTQIVHVFRKRKASSPFHDEDDEDQPPSDITITTDATADMLSKSEDGNEALSSSSSTVGASSVDDTTEMGDCVAVSSNTTSAVTTSGSSSRQLHKPTHPVTIRTTKMRKKRLLSALLMKPASNNLDVDPLSATYTTTNATSTTSTSPTVKSATMSLARGKLPLAKPRAGKGAGGVVALKSPHKNADGGGVISLDEIYLTSSEDEEDALDQSEKSGPVACRECKQDVPNLTLHYRAANRPMKEFPCETCKFFNPSACALSAHYRMHTRSVPFICPDCGFYFSTVDSFLIHVKNVCFYDFKTIRFKCPECSLLKPSVPQFAEHLKRCHIRVVYKCSVCITSSYSSRVVRTHMERLHADAPRNIHEGYRCMLCPNVLVAKQSINVHIKRHVFGLQHLRYVYICKFCKKYGSSHMYKFAEHYNTCTERPLECPRTASKKSANATNSPDEQDATSATTAAADAPEKDPLSIEEWEADKLKNEYVLKPKWCVMCRTTKLNASSQSFFCNACVSYVNADGASADASATASNSDGAADKVDRPAVAGRLKRKLKCKLCKQFLNRDWSTITNHYLQDHHADFDVSVTKGSSKSSTAADGGAAGGSPASGHNGVSSRKRKISSLAKQLENAGKATATTTNSNGSSSANVSSNVATTTSGSCSSAVSSSTVSSISTVSRSGSSNSNSNTSGNSASTSTAAILPAAKTAKVECKYRCVKCGFSTNVRNNFHEHIVSHKTQSNTNYQCLECGECFIVRPSLEKHLIVVHKVRDIGEYYKENKISVAGSDEEGDGESKDKKTLSENQCEVCYMECTSKQQYDRHIRTHGMAFVAMQSRSKS